MKTSTRVGVAFLEAGLAATLGACASETTNAGAAADDGAAEAAVTGVPLYQGPPKFDTRAGETNMLRHLDHGVTCVGATALRQGDIIHISVELDPPDAKGVQMKVTFGGDRTETGYVEGTEADVATGAGGFYGRFNATAYIPFGTKGAFNQVECPAAGITQG